jgi:hypothetical protein
MTSRLKKSPYLKMVFQDSHQGWPVANSHEKKIHWVKCFLTGSLEIGDSFFGLA